MVASPQFVWHGAPFTPKVACHFPQCYLLLNTLGILFAWLEAHDLRPNAYHVANDLMAGHDRIRSGKPTVSVIADLMQVRVANAAIKNLDNYIVWPRIAAHKAIWGQGILSRLCCVA